MEGDLKMLEASGTVSERGDNASIQTENPDIRFLTSIRKTLGAVSSLSSTCSIHRVPTMLRSVNAKAYNPRVISIGPFHRGEKRLQVMEKHKWRYLRDFLGWYPHIDLEVYVRRLRDLEGRARQCYAEPIKLGSRKFVEMMLLDGFFILTLFLKIHFIRWDETSDPIYYTQWMRGAIIYDLILLENQIPFVVLEHLFEVFNQDDQCPSLLQLTYNSLRGYFLETIENSDKFSTLQVKHLLDFVRACHLLTSSIAIPQVGGSNVPGGGSGSGSGTNVTGGGSGSESGSNDAFIQLEELLQFFKELLLNGGIQITRSVTELHEAGVQFKAVKKNLFNDISFENGVLELPVLRVVDSTELVFRNLIAFEQCDKSLPSRILSYALLMDNLINTPKDVGLLIEDEIIENYLGENEAVSHLFNNLCKEVTIDKFHFSEICGKLNAHCKISTLHGQSYRLVLQFYSSFSLSYKLLVLSFLNLETMERL
ncbi:hypothetical protein HHK36_033236 [Tetracentron sinense]|uniref:Uncharacterized protein n=1 Tax=Tetracentron sinense TaxID=13715 RepID=A0A835CYW2_TETSI|nr:hypothetical protein HHK36_033236 [Tetracentron sinense]